MEATGHPAVVLGGEAAGGPGLDVIDLAPVGGQVAERMEALSVPYLHRRLVAPVKVRLRTPTFLMRSGPSKTTRSTQPWPSHLTNDPGATTVPSANSQMRSAKLS